MQDGDVFPSTECVADLTDFTTGFGLSMLPFAITRSGAVGSSHSDFSSVFKSVQSMSGLSGSASARP